MLFQTYGPFKIDAKWCGHVFRIIWQLSRKSLCRGFARIGLQSEQVKGGSVASYNFYIFFFLYTTLYCCALWCSALLCMYVIIFLYVNKRNERTGRTKFQFYSIKKNFFVWWLVCFTVLLLLVGSLLDDFFICMYIFYIMIMVEVFLVGTYYGSFIFDELKNIPKNFFYNTFFFHWIISKFFELFRYQQELPKRIKQRGKDAHMVHEELVQTMKWKQTVGIWYLFFYFTQKKYTVH